MKMKKIFLMAFCCVMATTVFSSCAAGDKEKNPVSSVPSQQNPSAQNPTTPQTPAPEQESSNTPPVVTPVDGQVVSEEEWNAAFERLLSANDITINYAEARFDAEGNALEEEEEVFKFDDGREVYETEGGKGETYYELKDDVTYRYYKDQNEEWTKEEYSSEEMGFVISECDFSVAIKDYQKYYSQMEYNVALGAYMYQTEYVTMTVMVVGGQIYGLSTCFAYGAYGAYSMDISMICYNYGTTSIVLPTVKTEDEEEIPPADNTTYERLSDGTINFGSYPQTLVEDSATTTTLTNMSGELSNWTSYAYHMGGKTFDYMYYKDVVYNGEKYRGVYFNQYRPSWATDYSNVEYSDQYDNGYYTENYYWFQYEPLNWTILEEADGRAFLLCNSIIDSQEYYKDNEIRTTLDGVTVYPNNYQESYIRQWLNASFYEAAFTELQQSIINTTLVDNSAQSTNPYGQANYWNNGVNEYVCEDTYDKVFLLSEEELTNELYGFMSDPWGSDKARLRYASDYAMAQGCFIIQAEGEFGDKTSCWWTRSPYYQMEEFGEVYTAFYASGEVNGDDYIFNTTRGVVPALWIKL